MLCAAAWASACSTSRVCSSVHRARRNKDQMQVALKLWHRPVSLTRPGADAASPSEARARRPSSEMPAGPPCDSEDVACFEQEG